MTLFVMTWPNRPEIALVDEATAAHAEDRLRDGRVRPMNEYGAPQVREVERGVMLTFHPLHFSRHQGEEPASLKMEIHPGAARSRPDPRYASPREAWFDFQELAGALLERYPALLQLVPSVVRDSWSEGTSSILDVLVEVAERVVPDLIDLETSAAKAASGR